MVDSYLPPLKHKEIIVPKGWMERKLSSLDNVLLKAALHPQPWWRVIATKALRFFAHITYYFGHVYPYFLRPWRWVCLLVTRSLRKKHVTNKFVTPKQLFMERMFYVFPKRRENFKAFYALLNWMWVILCISLIPAVIEGIYAYGTINTYEDVIVTQSYRQITKTNTFAVHGYQLEPNGSKTELYFEIGPNLWHWDLFPEFLFGQISNYDRCTFKTYGWSIRIPKAIRVLSEDGIYILNPWIIAQTCLPPTIIPKAKE